MACKINDRPRGRPRSFALADAIECGQHLFHEHGYENVSVAMLTKAIGISPPSFYAAFDSKRAFFNEALRHYSSTVLPLDRFLISGLPPQTALSNMLMAAATVYASHPQRRGCFILEHARNATTEEGCAAIQIASKNRDKVRAFLDGTNIAAPDDVADYIAATMLGLSAAAREGWSEKRLIIVVKTTMTAFSSFKLLG